LLEKIIQIHSWNYGPNNYLSGKIKVSAYTLEKQYKITNSALTIHHQRRKPEFAVGDSATHRMHHQHFP